MKNKTAAILCVVWLLVMVGIAASTGTLLLSGKDSGDVHWVSDEEYAVIERYSRLETVRRELLENYYIEVDEQQLVTGAVEGMLGALNDPYTFYYTPDEMAQQSRENEGNYLGLGILIQNNSDGRLEILRVYEDSPAHDAGLKVGDCILKVNGMRVDGTSDETLDKAISLMKGEEGTAVEMEVLRKGEIVSLAVVRGDVNVSNAAFSVMDGNIGYINIFQFTGDDVHAFESARKALEQAGISGLIIDLRNNPGGILDDVVRIADHLLPKGTVVYVEDRAGRRTDYYSDDTHWDIPLVVLVNDMSASASEILAAAVQDFDRGTIVGTKTYGKGIVQTVISYEDAGDGIQYTSACYYTPDGRSIHGVGVMPDYIVEDESGYNAYSGEPNPDEDIQLKYAIEILNKGMN